MTDKIKITINSILDNPNSQTDVVVILSNLHVDFPGINIDPIKIAKQKNINPKNLNYIFACLGNTANTSSDVAAKNSIKAIIDNPNAETDVVATLGNIYSQNMKINGVVFDPSTFAKSKNIDPTKMNYIFAFLGSTMKIDGDITSDSSECVKCPTCEKCKSCPTCPTCEQCSMFNIPSVVSFFICTMIIILLILYIFFNRNSC